MKKTGTVLERNTNAKIYLDNVAQLLHTNNVRHQDVKQKIVAALTVDAKRLAEISEEMSKYGEAYHRYIALQREQRAHEESAKKLVGLIHEQINDLDLSDQNQFWEEFELWKDPTDLELWEAVQQYLRFVEEAQVGEILAFLTWAEIKTSRQAIDAVVSRHKKVFQIKKRGREKFVSLKA